MEVMNEALSVQKEELVCFKVKPLSGKVTFEAPGFGRCVSAPVQEST